MPLPAIPVAATKLGASVSAAEKVFGRLRNLLGPRKRSMCDTVAPEDVQAFLSGSAAPWKVDTTKGIIAQAWGLDPSISYEELGLTFEDVAHIHVNHYVPFCRSQEGDRLTSDPNKQESIDFQNIMRRDFGTWIKQGKFPAIVRPEKQMDGGEMPLVGTPSKDIGETALAGLKIPGGTLGIVGAVALGALALGAIRK